MTDRIRKRSLFSGVSGRNFFSLFSFFFLFLWFHLGTRLVDFAKDPGVGWHIASGEWVLENFAVPWIDPFLAYSDRLNWVSDQWGADTIMAVLFRISGWVGVYNFFIFVYIATFFLILYPFVRLRSGSALAGCVATLFASKPTEIHFILRPVLFGFFFVALLARLLPHFDQKSTISPARVAILNFLLFLFWANLHPSFAYGLALIVIFVVVTNTWNIFVLGDVSGDIFVAIKNNSKGILRALIGVSSGVLGSLCNPYGYRLHESIFMLGASKFFMRLHQEWLPLDILEVEGNFFCLFAIALLVGGWISLRKEAKVSTQNIGEIALLIVSARAGFAHTRMIPYFFILASPFFAQSLISIGAVMADWLSCRVPGVKDRFLRRERNEAERASPFLMVSIFSLVCLLGAPLGRVAGFPTYIQNMGEAKDKQVGSFLSGAVVTVREGHSIQSVNRSLRVPLGPPTWGYPYGGVQYLNSKFNTITLTESGHQGKSSLKVLNPPEWGGFLTLYGKGNIRPFFDDRNTLVGEARYLSYLRRSADCGSLLELAKELEADYLIVPVATLRMGGCLDSEFSGTNSALSPTNSAGSKLCENDDPCWSDSVRLQMPNYRDDMSAIFSVTTRDVHVK